MAPTLTVTYSKRPARLCDRQTDRQTKKMRTEWLLPLWVLVVVGCLHPVLAQEQLNLPSDTKIMDLKMKGAKPTEDDAYLCASYPMPEKESYIVKFEAKADANTAHHILLFGCKGEAYSTNPIWGCPPICKDRGEQIMFAWAKNAPPTQLPKDVGFRVGGDTSIKTIVLQIHYAKKFNDSQPNDFSGIQLYLTEQRQKYVAGIYLMLAYFVIIPPHAPKVHADISCLHSGETAMHPFAFRTHAHSLSQVISAYKYNNTWYELGKGNPQWPQAFYPMTANYTIQRGDYMVARCTYNATNRDVETRIGATGKDEMCNFYIMYYTDASVQSTYRQCGGNNFPQLVRSIPADSDVPLPPNPALEEEAHSHHHHSHSMAPVTGNIIVNKKTGPQPGLVASTMAPTTTTTTTTLPPPRHLSETAQFDGGWQLQGLGEVGGVAVDSHGNVYVFHRGSRKWEATSFDEQNNFMYPNIPIKENTIMVYDKSGTVLRHFGANRFFMPHGIEVDKTGNIWLTDVALHQVMRIPAGAEEPNLVLGEKFVPGADQSHYCKPTDVAVLSTGDFFVSDGYCNGRIIKYSADGKFLKEIGQQDWTMTLPGEDPPFGAFDIPHSITVAEELNMFCVADRENGRIQCFDLDGKFLRQIRPQEFGPRLFALEYCPQHGGLLFAVNGPTWDNRRVTVQGFTLDARTGRLLQTWNTPKGLSSPHDVAVDPVNHAVYVGELAPTGVWRFFMRDPTKTPPAVADTPDKKWMTPASKTGGDSTAPVPMSAAAAGNTSKVIVADQKSSDFAPSIIIGVLLVVPVALLLIITILFRLHHAGKLQCLSRHRKNKVFSLQSFLNSHKGFDRLSTEESDHELDPNDDSDQDEYTAPMKGKL